MNISEVIMSAAAAKKVEPVSVEEWALPPGDTNSQTYWDAVPPRPLKIHKFLHQGGPFAVGVKFSIIAMPYSGYGPNSMHVKGSTGQAYYWTTGNGADAPSLHTVGDRFEVTFVDSSYVNAKEITVVPKKALVKTELDNVSISVKKIRKMATESPEAKKIFQAVAPIVIDWTQSKETGTIRDDKGRTLVECRAEGRLAGGLWLNPLFDWEIEKDGNHFVLVATTRVF
jgi:hypothetical protein